MLSTAVFNIIDHPGGIVVECFGVGCCRLIWYDYIEADYYHTVNNIFLPKTLNICKK